MTPQLPKDFLNLSTEIGSNPLLVQGAGGNTSVKTDGVMWIKASGTELANANSDDIFVAVDPVRAKREIDGEGDGSCRAALLDADSGLRPSIETTFHAMFDRPFVFHFHSVATICHAIAEQGRELLSQKLDGIAWVRAPYRKPGVSLTVAIREAVGDERVDVVVLDNHGVIVVGDTIDEVARLIDDVERRLELPEIPFELPEVATANQDGWQNVSEFNFLERDPITRRRAVSGTYYPDHVVFLGPALPAVSQEQWTSRPVDDFPFPAVLVNNCGVFIKDNATPAQHAMLGCLADILKRIPQEWSLCPIGSDAEEALLNWDAEKYRQMLAKRDS